MYRKDGENYFVVDSHVHFWDGSPANQANRYGKGFIECFFDYHRNLSPEEYHWPKEKFEKYSEETLVNDLFHDGYVDKAIFQPTYLADFYVNGFNTTEQDGAVAERHPGKFIVNGAFDPREGEAGLARLEALTERWRLHGVKLYTAEWRGESKGWKLTDPWAYRYLEKCEQLGISNIHIHKGPTIYPLNRDAFDVADVDDVATAFPNLNFIIEHVGLPRLEDFCWIATQEPNVYGGLAVVMPFIHSRPRYFAQVIGELLYWLDENRITFASDYAIWHPKWLVERFVDFQIPGDMQGEYGVLTADTKRRILGINAARLYDIEVPAEVAAQLPESERAGGGLVSAPRVPA
ncbi:amidohydrolase family protein [Allosalinactinospora lopnorensis]|uniref:amidohydrolase family protein n=1 Tax=Allosalinactinospora lopnorensis TaxID=1352348 RepID=UPI000623E2B4|nr:amidohydrolase family protein [Allosalinactinospora lopnorensis]